jgi:hypothetical protein
MRLTRPRFTVRRLMVAVAVVACLLAFAARPYPTMISTYGPFTVIYWSDGHGTAVVPGKGTLISRKRSYGPVMRVDWGDGSASWYLALRTPRYPRPDR